MKGQKISAFRREYARSVINPECILPQVHVYRGFSDAFFLPEGKPTIRREMTFADLFESYIQSVLCKETGGLNLIERFSIAREFADTEGKQIILEYEERVKNLVAEIAYENPSSENNNQIGREHKNPGC